MSLINVRWNDSKAHKVLHWKWLCKKWIKAIKIRAPISSFNSFWCEQKLQQTTNQILVEPIIFFLFLASKYSIRAFDAETRYFSACTCQSIFQIIFIRKKDAFTKIEMNREKKIFEIFSKLKASELKWVEHDINYLRIKLMNIKWPNWKHEQASSYACFLKKKNLNFEESWQIFSVFYTF